MKARLVADGRGQGFLSDEETSSPTASISSLFALCAIGAKKLMKVCTMDVPGAYLKASMPTNKNVIMKLDTHLSDILINLDKSFQPYIRNDGIYVRLNKALYGCKESGKLWYDTISNHFINLGFRANSYDRCIFYRCLDSKRSWIVLYVDDILILADDQSTLDNAIIDIKRIYDDVVINHGSKHDFLGMVISFNQNGTAVISMQNFIADLFRDFRIVSNVKSPAKPDLFIIDNDSPLLNEYDTKLFHSMTAKLLYLAKRTRPDILLVVNFLSTRVKSPSQQDMSKLEYCLMYLYQTKRMNLILSTAADLSLSFYIDSSYGVHSDLKSHSGICASFGRGVIYAQSVKQKLNTRSSTEAELVGIGDGINTVIWFVNFLEELKLNVKPVVIYHDNTSVLKMLVKGHDNNIRSRHINIRYYFVMDYIANGYIVMKHKASSSMLADMLTKALIGKRFEMLREMLMGVVMLL